MGWYQGSKDHKNHSKSPKIGYFSHILGIEPYHPYIESNFSLLHTYLSVQKIKWLFIGLLESIWAPKVPKITQNNQFCVVFGYFWDLWRLDMTSYPTLGVSCMRNVIQCMGHMALMPKIYEKYTFFYFWWFLGPLEPGYDPIYYPRCHMNDYFIFGILYCGFLLICISHYLISFQHLLKLLSP